MSDVDPIKLVEYVVGAGVVALYFMVKVSKKPLQRQIGAWAASRGYKFYAGASVDLSRKLGLPLTFRYENMVITDLPGGNVGCIYRKIEEAADKPKIRLQAENEEDLPGDLCARVTLTKGVSGKGVLVPKGEAVPAIALKFAPSANLPVACAANRYEMYTDGILEAKDFPDAFYAALDAFPSSKKVPVVVVDAYGLWFEDPFHRGFSERGYDSLRDFCHKVAGTIAKWKFPTRGMF